MMNAKMSSKHDIMHTNDGNYVSKSSKNDELMLKNACSQYSMGNERGREH